jgi:hypothetical protein
MSGIKQTRPAPRHRKTQQTATPQEGAEEDAAAEEDAVQRTQK